jgi:hypothetical protein
MDHRQIVRMLACMRIAIGATLVLAPRRGGDLWIGKESRNTGAKLAIRSAGVRDLALGLGSYQALAEGTPVRPWVLACMVSDATDCVATTLALRKVGLRRSLPLVVAAAASSVYFATIAEQVDPA